MGRGSHGELPRLESLRNKSHCLLVQGVMDAVYQVARASSGVFEQPFSRRAGLDGRSVLAPSRNMRGAVTGTLAAQRENSLSVLQNLAVDRVNPWPELVLEALHGLGRSAE
jgi:hypothetical protein